MLHYRFSYVDISLSGDLTIQLKKDKENHAAKKTHDRSGAMSKQTELTVLGNTREGQSDQKHQHKNRTLTNRGIFVQYAS